MNRVQLGRSSLQCSRLAYGGWRLAGSWDPSSVTVESRARGKKALLAAVDAGFSLFDLADIYCAGIAEEIFGEMIAENPALRKDLLIATKCGIRQSGKPKVGDPYRYDLSKDYIVKSCEASLRRMKLDTIDLFQLHRPDFLGDPTEVAGAFEHLVKTGKARFFGVSNFKPSQVEALQKACPMPLLVNQVEISLARLDTLLDGTLDQCLRDQITPLAWSPLARGKLGTVLHSDFEHSELPLPEKLLTTLDSIAKDHGSTRSNIALAWLLKHPAKIIPIVGSIDESRIREAAKAESLNLSREEWYRLLEAAYGKRLP